MEERCGHVSDDVVLCGAVKKEDRDQREARLVRQRLFSRLFGRAAVRKAWLVGMVWVDVLASEPDRIAIDPATTGHPFMTRESLSRRAYDRWAVRVVVCGLRKGGVGAACSRTAREERQVGHKSWVDR